MTLISSTAVSVPVIGGVWWIKLGQEVTINEVNENIVSGVQLLEGVLVVEGRNTIL